MVKVKQPLLSFDARRKLGDDIVFKRQGRTAIVETRPIPQDARSVGQLSWRHMFQKVVALWHGLSAAEKEAWESLARPRHMTGYAWFVALALRPNPGIYLPLQGGTMQGIIDMGGFRIEDLPDPTLAQDPVTHAYYWANLPVGGYTEGVRAYHSASQSIPTATPTTLSFDSERYDTDAMHHNAVNNSRLTCKTAGKYAIAGSVNWQAHATGFRALWILLNGVSSIAEQRQNATAVGGTRMSVATIYALGGGDYAELLVFHTAGVARVIYSSGNFSPEFAAQRIG